MTIDQSDLDAIEEQLGRTPRGILEIASRCPSGHPNVVKTEPRLDDGTPFPTMFYLTCDRLAAEIGTLEASGLMREMTERHRGGRRARRPLPARPRLLPRRARGHRSRTRDRRHHRRRDADPGQVPARAGRPLTRQGSRASTRSATKRSRCSATGGPATAAVPRQMTEPRTRVAAFDCGTNSIRLLICDLQGDVKTDHLREMKIVRLGQDVDRTGRLADEAIGRTLSATRDYAELIPLLGVERIVFCATSAVRDAENGEAFCDAIEGILGVRPIVLDGPAEARATFLGATRDLDAARTLVVDIGGGSTEVVVGSGEELESASVARHRVRTSDRTVPARRSADRGPDRRLHRAHRLAARPDRVLRAGRAVRRRRRHRSRRSPRTRSSSRRTTRARSTAPS